MSIGYWVSGDRDGGNGYDYKGIFVMMELLCPSIVVGRYG
jgi:hypothetical protein